MPSIKGIFEPFAKYVQDQLSIRKRVISRGDKSAKILSKQIRQDEEFSIDGVVDQYGTNLLNNITLTAESKEDRGELFHAYTTQKQCIIRMASGVDVIPSNTFLESNEESDLLNSGAAKRYILEGGPASAPQLYDEYYTSNNFPNSYGDPKFRSDPDGEYGAVPKPGITDATISTKSDDGSLREALVNFRCFNRRQLEMLETLYMRPGYPILLEWGWSTYISNEGEVETSDYNTGALEAFFNENNNFDDLNKKIRNLKENTDGNYDGFIGYVKNFSFKAMEDGGFECTTEIMAQGEILETFKAKKIILPTNLSVDELNNSGESYSTGSNSSYIEDSFLYYLKSIKTNTDKAGDSLLLQYKGTKKIAEKDYQIEGSNLGGTHYVYEFEDGTKKTITELNSYNSVYNEGYQEIIDIFKEVTKLKDINGRFTELEQARELGLRSILGGTILKEVAEYDATKKYSNFGFTRSVITGTPYKTSNTGYRKNVYVRWDLLVQIINQLCSDLIKENPDGRPGGIPLKELTFLGPNQPSYSQETLRQTSKEKEEKYYIEYSAPECQSNDPACSAISNKDDRKYNSHPILGVSYDTSVCIMPHQPYLDNILEGDKYTIVEDFTEVIDPKKNTYTTIDAISKNLSVTSYENVNKSRYSIGLVYFNLDYLLETYESLRFIKKEEKELDTDEIKVTTSFNKESNFFDFIKKIWDDVNDACGGYYNFQLHIEHERPHVGRIIDKTMKGIPEGELFKFNPQGRESISRDFSYESKLDSSFADAVSIAAQVPKEVQSLESVSFKAFHKGIKSRFTNSTLDNKHELAMKEEAALNLQKDIREYKKIVISLYNLIVAINSGNYTETSFHPNRNKTSKIREKIISTTTAKGYASKLQSLQRSIFLRHPLKNKDGTHHDNAGLYKNKATLDRNAIIPLKCNITLDGISGIIPLQLFKIQSNRLPSAYKADNIAFIVTKETNKITAGQDWTTSVEGNLTLLNTDDDDLGVNNWDDDDIKPIENTTESEALDNEDEVDLTPNAETLRKALDRYNEKEFIQIEEKIKSEYHPQGEIASGGDIEAALVVEMENIFTALSFILDEKIKSGVLEQGYKTNMTITGGNDKYHQNLNYVSNHALGKAIDFVVEPYNNTTKEIIETTLNNNPKIKFINEYENLSSAGTAPHFHISLI